MRTRLIAANPRSRSFPRHASILAALVGASALVFIEPVFAQTDYDSGTPAPIGSTSVPNPETDYATPPSFDEPWVTTPSEGPLDLSPAPREAMAPEQSPIYTPPPPVGLIETGRGPVPATNPQFLAPAPVAIPHEGRLDGRIDGYIR